MKIKLKGGGAIVFGGIYIFVEGTNKKGWIVNNKERDAVRGLMLGRGI